MRTVEHSRIEVRFVAEATMDTGAVLSFASEWGQWNADPDRLIWDARRGLQSAIQTAARFNVRTSLVRVYREDRNTLKIVETNTKRSMYAEYPEKG